MKSQASPLQILKEIVREEIEERIISNRAILFVNIES